ncbi:MAG: transporter substrate-binding domain-containing protein [Proteobacteria bacterium]|nr:transporter substrate-binding domain-containing protein [Pseudomonadota bacterium]MBU1058762.1 transporter substrate-binding domain-containing protein [Pseudomonadota bacterium]
MITRLIQLLLAVTLLFSQSAEARDWPDIQKSGTLRVGIRDSSEMLYTSNSLQYPGLLYEMIYDFATSHQLTIEIVIIPSFADYWKKDDIILLKTDLIATPDIYNKIDIAADIFTVTPERQKLIHMTPFIDNTELIFGRKNDRIDNYQNLIGKILLTYEAMSFSNIVQNSMDAHSIPYVISYVDVVDDHIVMPSSKKLAADAVNLYLIPQNSSLKGNGNYFEIAQNQADASISDALNMIFRLYENTFFKENLKPLFRARAELSQLAWGSRLNDMALHKQLAEFLIKDKASGNFSKRLLKYTGFTLEEYQEILQLQ